VLKLDPRLPQLRQGHLLFGALLLLFLQSGGQSGDFEVVCASGVV
jgi:hypothetical protein